MDFDQLFDDPNELPPLKRMDHSYFRELLSGYKEPYYYHDDEEARLMKKKRRKVLRLLLEIKNGTPPRREAATKQLVDNARDFGVPALCTRSTFFPLLIHPSLDDVEKHLLLEVFNRVLVKLDDLVCPAVCGIVEWVYFFLRIENFDVQCREIISTLSKVAGLETMVCVLHQNVDNKDEDERDLAAITGSIVASALGVPALLPFLKEVCEREDSWHARHIGVKTVQQIVVLLGSDVRPHLKSLVGIIGHCLNDENEEVQSITALSLSALAEASAPNGFESFDSVFITLWNCTSLYLGKVLGDFLVVIGSIIPLMDATHAAYYAKEVMDIIIRLIKWNDFQTKETVVKVMSRCLSTEGVDADYYRKEILPEFFRNSGGSNPGH